VFTKALSVTASFWDLCLICRLFAYYAYGTIGYNDDLAAGVGIQAIIVRVVAKNEKMLHVITQNEQDAFKVITEIFELQQETK